MRFAARVDKNQSSVVKALRLIGCTVQPIHAVGRGVPDLLVGVRGVNLLLEVKDGDKPQSRQSLTADEREWHKAWRGQVAIVNSPEQAVMLINSMTANDKFPF